MSKTGYLTLPLLRGPLVTVGPWAGLFARAAWRIYPYHLGAMVRTAASSGTVLETYGYGQFAANDYLMACAAVAYGANTIFVPDTERVFRVASLGGSDDELNLTAAITATTALAAGEWLLNLGADTASPSGSVAPNYDGSRLTLYSGPTTDATSPGTYVTTGSQGDFRVWLESGTYACDILLVDSSGTPRLVIPTVQVGPELLA